MKFNPRNLTLSLLLLITSQLMAQNPPTIVDDEIYVSPIHIMCNEREVEAYAFKIITDDKKADLWYRIKKSDSTWDVMFTLKEPQNIGQVEKKDCYDEYPDAWVAATNNLISEKFNRILWFGGDKIMQFTLRLPPSTSDLDLNVYLCSNPDDCPPEIMKGAEEHDGTIHFPCNDEC
ncbi:hypothetical protein [Ekhidna sp.]|uniref:hypothetical protein n=1 Tax=Ekhidna sp. TaxID=2608089 RepID=UPI003B50B3E0